ncbi:MAG: peptidoglycan DD-metalloendopeptidase family protein [Clostridia bacterium]|nr:peptidoglycan DD-metalloendopeptidase family protein [Clostridia bacterium]
MSKNLKYLIGSLLICVTVAFAAVFLCISGFSSTSLEDLQNEIENKQNQSENIAEKINNLKDQKKSTEKTAAQNEAELARLRKELSKEYTEKEKALEELNDLKSTIEELDGSIAETQAKYEKNVTEFLERARIMYRYSDYSTLELVLESKNVLDFSTRANMYKHMISYDTNFLQEIEDLKNDLDSKKAYQESIKNDKESIITEINAMIAYLKASEENTLANYNSNINKLESLKEQQEKLEKEEAVLDAKIKLLMAESKKYTYEGGKMLWPAPSWTRISDVFGYRSVHPITGLPAFHGGIDIAAPYGSNILAAAGGKVVVVSYSSGSGNYIVVDHGGGIMTMYAHASKIVAKVGDTVKRGQVIALVGSTGASTGNHLHFEVRVDNTKVDPLIYLDVPNK